MNWISRIFQGNARTVRARKNIGVSALIKGADMLVYFLLVPLSIGYLNKYEYGIWLALNSFLSWINYFDIGLGSGLRNKLAVALADDDRERARAYVSTTFGMLIILMSVIFLAFSLAVNHIDWFRAFNVAPETVPNLKEIIIVSFAFFCLNFIFKFIGNVYQALQLPAVTMGLTFGGHLLSLVVIFILTRTLVPGSLFAVAVVYSAAPPVIYALSYPITFFRLFRFLSPSVRYFRKDCLKDVFSLSIGFFLLQIAGLVLFTFSNLIISRMFGPEEVTPYNIVYRYFSVIPILMTVVLSPMWSAATDAYARGDTEWIRRSNARIRRIMYAVAVLLVAMVCVDKWVYHIWIDIWVKDPVAIPAGLSLYMACYVFIFTWSSSYSNYLNGMGALRLQTVHTIFAAAIFVPLCHLLGSRMGVCGIVAGMCLTYLPGAILNTVQFHLIMKGSARGLFAAGKLRSRPK